MLNLWLFWRLGVFLSKLILVLDWSWRLLFPRALMLLSRFIFRLTLLWIFIIFASWRCRMTFWSLFVIRRFYNIIITLFFPCKNIIFALWLNLADSVELLFLGNILMSTGLLPFTSIFFSFIIKFNFLEIIIVFKIRLFIVRLVLRFNY